MEYIQLASKIMEMANQPYKDNDGMTHKLSEWLIAERLKEWLKKEPVITFPDYVGKKVKIPAYSANGEIVDFKFSTKEKEALFVIRNEDTKEIYTLNRKSFKLLSES